MPTCVTVQQGDCIASIAYEHGFFPDTVWDYKDNSDLKELRKNPNVLFPGDTVHIPDLTLGSMDAPTAQRHRYRRRGVPEVLRVRFLVEGEPRKGQNYRVDLDGDLLEGTTDDDGWLELTISPDAQQATVRFEGGAEYVLELGGMDPITEVSGVQKRLANLRLYDGPIDGEPSASLTRAVSAFQQLNGLTVTGEVDENTRSALAEAAG